MSHDLEAAYAAAEVAKQLYSDPTICFASPPLLSNLSTYAAREGRHSWPHADGVIELVVTGTTLTNYSIALEFKRPNEGLHGVLTAIGQSHAYLRKGYAGSVIVIPEAYPGFGMPGPYVKEVLDLTSQSDNIGVLTYAKPDMSKVSPFAGRLTIHRNLKVDARPPIVVSFPPARTETQWAHVREGSTDPDAFFKYLQSVKLLGGGGASPHSPSIPNDIELAIARVRPGSDPNRYLSNCPGNKLADEAWRHFWFKYVLHDAALTGWSINSTGIYETNNNRSHIERFDGRGKKLFFVGRSDSIKNKLVAKLNSGSITEDEAHDSLVENYFDRAHSYREDIDSGCAHFGFVDDDGRLTDEGYKFVSACERYGDANNGLPRALFQKAVLQEGSLGAFLHYIHRLSELKFSANPLAFSSPAPSAGSTRFNFDQQAYLTWLESEMRDNLRVIRKVSTRGGVTRKPFQAELALLRNLGIVGAGFRVGVGLVINWPEFQDALAYANSTF